MKISSIKVGELDTKFSSKPTRTGIIKIGSSYKIQTPIRAANLYEYNAKTKVPTDIQIGSQLSIKFTSISYNTMSKLLTELKPFTNLSNAQENANKKVQHTDFNFAVFQPTINVIKKKKSDGQVEIKNPAMEILKDEKHLKTYLDLIQGLQVSLKFDIITIPYLNLPFEILKQVYKKRAEVIIKEGKYPFFVLDLKHKPGDFSKLLDLLINDLGLKLIGLLFKRYKDAALNYLTLRQYYDKDVLFFTLQVGRDDSKYDNISSFHYMPFLVSDIYSIAAPRGHSEEDDKDSLEAAVLAAGNSAGEGQSKSMKSSEKPTYQERIAKLRLFDKKDLKVKPLPLMINNYNEILKDVSRHKSERMIDMLRGYSLEGSDEKETEEKYAQLNAFTRLHELKTSSSEFDNFRSFVEQRDTATYVSRHPILGTAISDMKYPKP